MSGREEPPLKADVEKGIGQGRDVQQSFND